MLAIMISILIIFHWQRKYHHQQLGIHYSPCMNPAQRREWRTLTRAQQHDYLEAAQCLMLDHPSIFRASTSAYDDFVFANAKAGASAHYAASSLPWHRMFVRVYERALQEKCGYEGMQP